MKLQTLAFGAVLAVASSFAAQAQETTVTRVTPHGTVTRHIVRTNDRQDWRHGYRHSDRHVVVMHPDHRHARRVVIVQPARHRHYAADRTVVVHRNG
jgi:hypothetical protein